jgi:hypothetical protein
MKFNWSTVIFMLVIFAAIEKPSRAQVCKPSSTTLCDGPAELPRVFSTQPPFPDPCPYVQGETGTDVCGFAVTHINAVEGVSALQNAVDAPACGTAGAIIALQPNAVFTQISSNELTLPYQAGSCAGKWIIIRSDLSDSSIPAYNQQGVRAVPADASLFATVKASTVTSAVIATAPVTPGSGEGANHYWFLGLNLTAAAGIKTDPILIQIGDGETQIRDLPNNITIDRCIIHGPDGTTNIHRDVDAEGTYIAVLNSWLSVVNNSTEQQTVGFYNTPGPILIDNNHLEGGAEQVLSGGAQPSIAGVLTSDVTITRNHMHRDTAYYPGAPNYNGFPLIVKNDIEFKEIQRLLVQGNVMDYVWAGYSQNGVAISIAPMSATGQDTNIVDNDITIRYNLIRHGNAALLLGAGDPNYGNGAQTEGMQRVSIHDNIFSDISTTWGVILQNSNKVVDRYYGISLVSGIDPISRAPMDVGIEHNDFLTGTLQATASWSSVGRFAGSGYNFSNNIISQIGASYGWVASGYTDNSCSDLLLVDPGAKSENNIFVGVPSGERGGYTSNCVIGPPLAPVLTSSPAGGSIPAGTTVYVQTTLVTPTGETTPSIEQPVPAAWAPLHAYNSGVTILDPNQGTELSYIATESGGQGPSWPQNVPSNLNAWTIETTSGDSSCNSPMQLYPPSPVCMGWILIANGARGTLQVTGVSNSNSITIAPPPSNDGPATQYKVYAGGSSGSEAYCGTYAIAQSATLTSLANCKGSAPPSVNTATVNPPTFVCNPWPSSYLALGFTNMAAGNYQLLASSCGSGAALDLFPGWAAQVLKSQYDTIQDPNGNYEMALTPGITGSTEPAWPTVVGGEVQDGAIIWQMSKSLDVGADVSVLDAVTANVGNN